MRGLSLAQAVAVFPFGTYTECGDATPDNVTKKVSPHFRRVALTEGQGAVLRDALNIDMVSVRKYGGRYWAADDADGTLVCVRLYKKGALEVVRQLSGKH